jgi:hypothetical protein
MNVLLAAFESNSFLADYAPDEVAVSAANFDSRLAAVEVSQSDIMLPLSGHVIPIKPFQFLVKRRRPGYAARSKITDAAPITIHELDGMQTMKFTLNIDLENVSPRLHQRSRLDIRDKARIRRFAQRANRTFYHRI